MTLCESDLPELHEWSPAAIRLLQGVVYHDDTPTWDLLLRYRSRLEDGFAAVALRLVVDEPEGFAYVRQVDAEQDGELPASYEGLPKLFHRVRLTYDATLLCVLLREELRRFEDEDVDNERCVISTLDLFEQWKAFFTTEHDDLRLRRTLGTALNKLDELKFVRRFSEEPEEWEVRRILKARLSAAELEKLKAALLAAQARD